MEKDFALLLKSEFQKEKDSNGLLLKPTGKFKQFNECKAELLQRELLNLELRLITKNTANHEEEQYFLNMLPNTFLIKAL